jgi:hypothetical protein
MAITTVLVPPHRTDSPETFDDDADQFAGDLAGPWTAEANALQTDVNAKQVLAAASSVAAGFSADDAAASATAAELAETNAEAAAAAAQAAAGLTPDADFGMVLATTANTAVKTSAYTAEVGVMQDVDTSGGYFVVTTPASPTVGQWFGIRDYNQNRFRDDFVIVEYSGDKIIGLAEDCFIDVNSVIFEWRGAARGWCV